MEAYQVLAIAVIMLLAGSIGALLNESRKRKEDLPWDKIRPLLIESFVRIQTVHRLQQFGYQQLEDYAVKILLEEIARISYLSDKERAMLTDTVVRSMIAPSLIQLYKKEQESSL